MKKEVYVEKKIIIDSKKGIGLVLGGGGARGGFQVGAIEVLVNFLKKFGLAFDLVVGTSVGFLNGSLVVADETDRLVKIWENLNLFKVLGIDFKSLKHGGLFSNGPLEKLIRKEINEKIAQKIIGSPTKLVGISSCYQNKQKIITTNFKNIEQFFRTVLSTSAIPVIYPFLELLSDDEREKIKEESLQLFDGGIISNTDILAAISFGLCKTFFIIPLYTPECEVAENKIWRYHSLLQELMRVMDVFFTNSYAKDMEIVRKNIEIANFWKDIIETGNRFPANLNPLNKERDRKIEAFYNEAGMEVFAGVQPIEISPKKLSADMLDFFPDKIRKDIETGREEAEKTLKNVKII